MKIGGADILVVAAVLPTARKQVLGPSLSERATADDAASLEMGEWEVRGDAEAETRFRFRTGITRVVPWPVVSEGAVLSAAAPVSETAWFRGSGGEVIARAERCRDRSRLRFFSGRSGDPARGRGLHRDAGLGHDHHGNGKTATSSAVTHSSARLKA